MIIGPIELIHCIILSKILFLMVLHVLSGVGGAYHWKEFCVSKMFGKDFVKVTIHVYRGYYMYMAA